MIIPAKGKITYRELNRDLDLHNFKMKLKGKKELVFNVDDWFNFLKHDITEECKRYYKTNDVNLILFRFKEEKEDIFQIWWQAEFNVNDNETLNELHKENNTNNTQFEIDEKCWMYYLNKSYRDKHASKEFFRDKVRIVDIENEKYFVIKTGGIDDKVYSTSLDFLEKI